MARHAGHAAAARAIASSVSSDEGCVTVVTGSSVAGLSTVNTDMRGLLPDYRRSKPRRSSQSVTAAS